MKPGLKVKFLSLLYVALHTTWAQNFPGWFTYDTLSSPLRSNLVTSLAVAPDRSMWIGTSSGLARLSEQLNWTLWDTSNSPLTDNWIKCLHMDYEGILWIGTLNGGLFGLNNGTWTHYHTGNSPWLTNNISAVLRHPDGTLWVGTHGQGIYVLNGTSWQHYNSANTGLDISYINGLEVGDSGCVWVATHNAGLVRFCPSGWSAYTMLNTNFNTNHVQCVRVGPDGSLWVGLAGARPDSALHRFWPSTNTWTLYGALDTDDEGIRSVWDIQADQFGRVWVATNEITRGVWLYNDTVFTHFSTGYSGLANNRVFAVRERQDTSYWFATLSGLSFYKPSLSVSLENSGAPLLQVGPVPATDKLFIYATEPSGIQIKSLRLLHPAGLCLWHDKSGFTGDRQEITLSHIPAGLYLLEIHSSHGKEVKRIVKI